LTVGVALFLNKAFRWLKTGKFLEIANVLFGLCEDLTPNKDHGWKNYRPCSTRNFEATGAARENLRPFSFSRSDRLVRPVNFKLQKARLGQRTNQKYRNLVGSDQQMQKLENKLNLEKLTIGLGLTMVYFPIFRHAWPDFFRVP